MRPRGTVSGIYMYSAAESAPSPRWLTCVRVFSKRFGQANPQEAWAALRVIQSCAAQRSSHQPWVVGAILRTQGPTNVAGRSRNGAPRGENRLCTTLRPLRDPA